MNVKYRLMALFAAFVMVVLTGCAVTPRPATFEGLRQSKIESAFLVVEDAPFAYSFGGIAYEGASAGFGSLFALAGVSAANTLNAELAQAVKAKGVGNDHRAVFLKLLTQQFSQKGIEMQVVSMPYPLAPLSLGNRAYAKPDRAALNKLALSAPVFVLQLDIGSCGSAAAGAIYPCIATSLDHHFVSGGPFFSGTYFRMPAAKPTMDSAFPKSYQNGDEAIRNVAEFDDALSRLVPLAVVQVVTNLQTNGSK